jgi:DnaK suppressor protein
MALAEGGIMSTAYSINELARIEAQLESQLAEVNRRIEASRRSASPEEWQGGGDNTPLSEGADAARAMEERDSESERMTRLLERADGLRRALDRIDGGTYGTCERCQRPIDSKRLRVLPEAPYCVKCEEQIETVTPPHSPKG